jgi:hypothetical protein
MKICQRRQDVLGCTEEHTRITNGMYFEYQVLSPLFVTLKHKMKCNIHILVGLEDFRKLVFVLQGNNNSNNNNNRFYSNINTNKF